LHVARPDLPPHRRLRYAILRQSTRAPRRPRRQPSRCRRWLKSWTAAQTPCTTRTPNRFGKLRK
jgi:hypothetical protein